eukprot:30834-Eustigmatos_ZCMA.PRE.1
MIGVGQVFGVIAQVTVVAPIAAVGLVVRPYPFQVPSPQAPAASPRSQATRSAARAIFGAH